MQETFITKHLWLDYATDKYAGDLRDVLSIMFISYVKEVNNVRKLYKKKVFYIYLVIFLLKKLHD